MYECVGVHGRAYYTFCCCCFFILFYLDAGDVVGLSTISLGDMVFCSGFSGPHPLCIPLPVCCTVHTYFIEMCDEQRVELWDTSKKENEVCC